RGQRPRQELHASARHAVRDAERPSVRSHAERGNEGARKSYHTNSWTTWALPSLNGTGTSSSVLPADGRIRGSPPPSSFIFQPSMRSPPSPIASIFVPTAARKYRSSTGLSAVSFSVRRSDTSLPPTALGKSSTFTPPNEYRNVGLSSA